MQNTLLKMHEENKTRLDAIEAEQVELRKEMQGIRDDFKDFTNTINQARGGLRVLLWVGGVFGSIAALAVTVWAMMRGHQ